MISYCINNAWKSFTSSKETMREIGTKLVNIRIQVNINLIELPKVGLESISKYKPTLSIVLDDSRYGLFNSSY